MFESERDKMIKISHVSRNLYNLDNFWLMGFLFEFLYFKSSVVREL